MPLQLHPKARSQLHQKLVESLPEIVVNNRMFIDRRSAINVVAGDFSLPRNGKLHDALVGYLDEFPLIEFVLSTLGQELTELDDYKSDTNPHLNEMAEYADIPALATRLVDAFDSLPWTYQVTIPLPETLNDLLPPGEGEFDLTQNVRLVRPSQSFKNTFTLDTTNKARRNRLKGTIGLLSMLDDNPATWPDKSLLLQLKCEGFVDQYGSTNTSESVHRSLRSLFGLGLANRLLEYELRYTPAPLKTFAFVHRQIANGSWEPVARYELNDTVSRGIAGLKIAEHQFLDDEKKRFGWRYWRAKDIGTVLGFGKQSEPTVLAGQWLFDSYCGQDTLLSFIQSMVVLEILFGEKTISDEVGIGELISSRFAYAVGTTHEDRAELVSALKKIYKVRSQIVHAGKHRLNLEENALFSRLRWMCRRAIDKEIDLLKASSEKKKNQVEHKPS